ncbi:sublancin family glycopeptide [Mammaliicoccus sciuri]|uniref:sublancin family glycopeptide n=1 Tax=Mammaliicoccus sciuri TaxID=1296 RepID=UPI001330197C|nr:sublancin family glycopeptide [Mammaliicoccus sciuri]
MNELMRELSAEEMEKFIGGGDTMTRSVQGPPSGGPGGKKGGFNAAQCAYWFGLCATAASDQWGCGSTYENCNYYRKYC